MSPSGAEPGHLRGPNIRPHLPEQQSEQQSRDRESLEELVERQRARIEQLEDVLRPLSTAEAWALAWARENEPWKKIQRVLEQ